VKPFLPAVAPPPAGVLGRCRWCEVSSSRAERGEPFAVLESVPGFAGTWILVPKRHVSVLVALPPDEMVSVLAGLVKASKELARLSGAADVRVVPEAGPGGDVVGEGGSARREPRLERRRGHVRFHLVPHFSPGTAPGPFRSSQGSSTPSSSIA